jgi:hypothetical protein
MWCAPCGFAAILCAALSAAREPYGPERMTGCPLRKSFESVFALGTLGIYTTNKDYTTLLFAS